ncbi:MAG: cellulose biosynthesis cyclic di-GMP-binding regulatory protein BcsB [Pseudomonas sp.]
MSRKRNAMPVAWLALSLPLLMSLAAPAWSEEVVEAAVPVEGEAPAAETVVEAPVVEFVPTYSATLKQLGANYTMHLRGIEGSDSVSFDVRADQVVTRARVNLEYSYSPALLSDLSQINVMVNDQVAVSLPVPKETAGTLQQQQVEIPAHLITEFNRLTLQLIGHYTMMCEDPLHSSLWAKISNTSQLELETTQIALPDDLSKLPLPFFDGRDSRTLELPFVFAATPDNRTLEAAGAVSSWFGALASYRGARFPVSLAELPAKGNAIVLLAGAASIAGIDVAQGAGPSLSLVANPNDPYGKLLVIAGRDGEQVKQAALALVSGSQVLAGASARIERIDSLQPRKPYDAPNWLPSDRPVQLGELSDAKRLSVSGYDPGTINLPMRLPPDLFGWRQPGVPLHLKYRYTPQPVSTNSSLLISSSGKFIKSLPLPSQENLQDESLLAKLQQDDSLLQESKLTLPLESLPLQSSLQLRFMYDYIKQGDCRDIIIDNMRGTIEPDSTIDLSGYEHFIAMPNLGVFQSSGFPFTRMADLADTAVVMPNAAGADEFSLYLDVLGRFGDSTGLPATAVTVTQGDDDAPLQDKDLLVLAAGGNQPLLQRWADLLPASLDGSSSFELSDLVHRARTWVSDDDRANLRQARSSLALGTGGAGAYLTGFESPLDSERSVVVIAAASPDKLTDVSAALHGGEGYEQSIQGSLAVINGKRVSSLVAEEQYYVGELGWFRYLQWLLSRHLSLLLLLTALGVGLISVLLFVSLRARARARLSD